MISWLFLPTVVAGMYFNVHVTKLSTLELTVLIKIPRLSCDFCLMFILNLLGEYLYIGAGLITSHILYNRDG